MDPINVISKNKNKCWKRNVHMSPKISLLTNTWDLRWNTGHSMNLSCVPDGSKKVRRNQQRLSLFLFEQKAESSTNNFNTSHLKKCGSWQFCDCDLFLGGWWVHVTLFQRLLVTEIKKGHGGWITCMVDCSTCPSGVVFNIPRVTKTGRNIENPRGPQPGDGDPPIHPSSQKFGP